MTKSDLVKNLASRANCSLADAGRAYDALVSDLTVELRASGSVTMPGVAKLIVKKTPERQAGKKVVAGKEYDLEYKPASKTVRARVLKTFIDTVR